MVWISWDPALHMLLCSANLDKFPLNPTSSPLTVMRLSVTSLNRRSEYNLPYSFWKKKTLQNNRAQSSTASFPYFDQKLIPHRAERDAARAPSMCLHPAMSCLTLFVIYSPGGVAGSSAWRYFCCAASAPPLPPASCVVCAAHTATAHSCLPRKTGPAPRRAS